MAYMLIPVYFGGLVASFKDKISANSAYLDIIAMGALSAFKEAIWA